MKVIKRDGKAVDYNREKIEIAIEKANKEVKEQDRLSKDEIKEITKHIEDLGKKRILVEDIQDIIEEQIMNMKKFELARKYMIYRYTRALVRRQNTTDESILGLIKNQNRTIKNESTGRNSSLVAKQRDYIAGEVSKDLSKRILLPEKVIKAHEDRAIYFHNMEYFIQSIFNSSVLNIQDMLDNGTVINGLLIDTPDSFEVACKILMEIIAQASSSQYGMHTIDVSCLGKYARKSYNKIKKEFEELEVKDLEKIILVKLREEIIAGIQMLEYQINTLITSNGRIPNVVLYLNLDENDEYIKENAIIIEEILNRRFKGIKSKTGEYVTTDFPKLIYVLNENNSLNGGKYDNLTRKAIECTKKRGAPYYISAKKMKENNQGYVFAPMGLTNFAELWKDENGDYKFNGRFNQGIVTINLPQIAIIADGNEGEFWKLLDERLEISKEALMCKHYSNLGTPSAINPIDWNYGAISRLNEDETIDKLLKNGYSTLSLGYVGIYETTRLVKGVSNLEKEGYDFSIKLLKYINEKIKEWKKETGLGFNLYQTQDINVCKKFILNDREEYGEIKDITDKEYYLNAYYYPEDEENDIFKKIEFESEYQNLTQGGAITYLNISKIENLEEVIKYAYDNIQYIGFIK